MVACLHLWSVRTPGLTDRLPSFLQQMWSPSLSFSKELKYFHWTIVEVKQPKDYLVKQPKDYFSQYNCKEDNDGSHVVPSWYPLCHLTHQKLCSGVRSLQSLIDLLASLFYSLPSISDFHFSFHYGPTVIISMQTNVLTTSIASQKIPLTSLPWVIGHFSPKV